MKKLVSLILILTLICTLFIACKETKNQETSTELTSNDESSIDINLNNFALTKHRNSDIETVSDGEIFSKMGSTENTLKLDAITFFKFIRSFRS